MDANNPSSTKPEIAEGGIIEEKVSKVGGESSVRKYTKGRLLGKGGFARCYEVTNMETGRVYAAKIIVKATLTKARSRQKLISEIKIHKSLKHAGVVLFEHVFEDQENVYMLLELCANQSLHDLLKRRKKLTEVEVQCYIVQLVTALKYLHSHRVIHRDLKLGNLFLTDKMELKLGDFGLAAKLEFDGEKRRTVCGTPNYIAPEVIEGKAGHSYEVDIWAVGVIMYALLIGKPPFETPEVKQTYKKIKICSYAFPENAGISDHARSLITRILSLDPLKRPTLDEILQHPFINNGGAVPKLLPVSTLACPPSASYLKQYLPQGNSVPIMMDPPKFGETGTFNSTKNGRFFTAQKNNLMSSTSDRGFFNKPQSPSAQAQTQALTQTGETIHSGQHFERQGSKGDTWTLSKAGAYQISSMGSTGSLKTSARPQTVQQKEFRSSAALKPTQPGPSQQMGNTAGFGFGLNKGRPSMSSNEVWVKKWVDYSSKYGLGYLLSNGTSGVFFNDNTKIMMDGKGTKFEYVDKNLATKQDTKTVHSFEQYPKELQKKVTLLQHFKKYLDGDDKDGAMAEENEKNAGVYVKKWLKTKYAMMFRLSNKIVQMNFTDKTEIILSSENKMVTYLNKKGERSHFPLATALESTNTDMTKRLKYTKEVLSHMIGDGQQNQMPTLNY